MKQTLTAGVLFTLYLRGISFVLNYKVASLSVRYDLFLCGLEEGWGGGGGHN